MRRALLLILLCCWSFARFAYAAPLPQILPADSAPAVMAPPAHWRSAEQSWLTFPEWYLVHSPAEYARYLADDRPPSQFPWWGHIGQLWRSYARVSQAQLASRPRQLNPGYHLMIVVIATSTTCEYALRSLYELSIGRLAELSRQHGPTAEERFAAKTAQDYVDFIRERPWYEFDFLARLKSLWRDTGYGGNDLLRKWERKYALSTEYGIKAVYAWLIAKATRATYDAAQPVTAVFVDRWQDRLVGGWPEIKRIKSVREGGELLLLPRYHGFIAPAVAMARSGTNFSEIAGNGADTRLLLSVLVPADWAPDSEGAVSVFEQPVLSRPGEKRVVISVPIRDLAQNLRELDGMGIHIEHIYDF
ncbi:hypothetical protein [Uliginosibacterium sediminicola]|uniref:Uncharacterized protein n=1 Tax=Uliginosibacterium sediminicola TaxID=2024550 RepID=A0ABU9YXI4_9RHOO